jgi:hypothetical protein
VFDPGVRSVRVAVALLERFTQLLEGPTVVHSTHHHSGLGGVSGAQERLSMRIGEAQQLYPEIWGHLDDARTTFAARGVDVSAFDAIRAHEGQGLGVSISIAEKSYGTYHQVSKTAHFNRPGIARAQYACGTLMKATPEIDWAAIAKAESADPAAAEFARAMRLKRWARFGLLALVLATPFLILFLEY